MGKAVTGGGLSPIGIENLKIAIVKQAADDYIDLRGGFAVETAECNLKEIKRFFHSDWYSLLSKVNPDYILEELERKLKKDGIEIHDCEGKRE